MSDKHLGCYSLPPVKESRPEIRCEELFKGREACYPISNIYICIRLLSFEHQRGYLGRQLSDTHSMQKLLSEEFPSLSSIKHCYFGRNPRQYGTLFMVYEECHKHILTTHSTYFSSGIVCTTSDKDWIHI
jgi:hypothetical protein